MVAGIIEVIWAKSESEALTQIKSLHPYAKDNVDTEDELEVKPGTLYWADCVEVIVGKRLGELTGVPRRPREFKDIVTQVRSGHPKRSDNDVDSTLIYCVLPTGLVENGSDPGFAVVVVPDELATRLLGSLPRPTLMLTHNRSVHPSAVRLGTVFELVFAVFAEGVVKAL